MPTNQEEPKQDGLVKKKGKQLLRNRALKIGKKVGKLAVKTASKAALAAGKALIGVLGGVGLPFIGVVAAIVIGVFLIFIAISLIFMNSPESLDKEESELRAHIIKAADETVDMSKREQIPYRVPHELIIAAMQIYDTDSKVKSKKAATDLTKALRPIFEYETRESKVETLTTTCYNSVCSDSTSYSSYDTVILLSVDAWDQKMQADVEPIVSQWDRPVSSTTIDDEGNETIVRTRTRYHTFDVSETVEADYTLFDRELSTKPFNYGVKSKLAVEAIYQVTGGTIFYKEWLQGDSMGGSGGGFDGSVIPGAGVPTEYMPIYLAAEKKYKVDWNYLAAFHYVETKFSTHKPMLSSVGAEGHMQFMPCTFVGWNYPGCKGTVGYVDIPDSIKHNPLQIKKYGGEGVDGDGDGKADPWNLTDAISSTASYMNKKGFSKDRNGAIWAYNHSTSYVNMINAKAKEFRDAAEYIPNGDNVPSLKPGSFMVPAKGRISSEFGQRWGRLHGGIDVANSIGTPIVSVADGKVLHAACYNPCSDEWGKYVKVSYNLDGKTYETIYAHLSSFAVRKGDTVKQGQLLGLMGNTGKSTGPHLHFEIHPGGYKGRSSAVNPRLLVPF